MSEKHRDSRGRVLRNGESQRADGKYMFRYTDSTGERHTVYSWKLVGTDRLKRDSQALRDMEKRILKDLDDSIKTRDADHTTVDDLFDQFMDIRKDLRESSLCCYNDIYRKHIRPAIGNRPVGRVKPTEVLKMHPMSRSKPCKQTAPMVSGVMWCKMKHLSVLHQFLHQLNAKIHWELRKYEKFGNP